MKNLAAFAIFFSCMNASLAQKVMWAGTIDEKADFSGTFLAPDADGNIFHYGKNRVTAGESGFISKRDAAGSTSYRLDLGVSVIPTGMSKGPDGVMFVCGIFYGNAKIGSHVVNSAGSSDCFIAGLDAEGDFSWVSVIGSSGKDLAAGLAFNGSQLLVTGSTRSNFTFNGNTHQNISEESMFLALVSPQGQLSAYKIKDYRANDTTGNFGIALRCDASGSFYLLHQREGRKWFEDPSAEPSDGVYLSKLDATMEPVWSEFIINSGCYYGYESKRIAVASGGESYVPSFCSGKYGGEGLIRGFSSGGDLSAIIKNQDGRYKDVYSDGKDIYAVGTESANGCPCEANFAGYQVVRRLANDGTQSAMIVLASDAKLNNVAVTAAGAVIVTGEFSGPQLQVGGYTLINKTNGGSQPFMFAIGESQQITSLSANSENMISVFPNPSSGEVSVRLPVGNCAIAVINMTGQVVYRNSNIVSSGQPVSLPALPRGVFVVVVSYDGRAESKTVIVR